MQSMDSHEKSINTLINELFQNTNEATIFGFLNHRSIKQNVSCQINLDSKIFIFTFDCEPPQL